jgi:hypothetical protein
VDSLCYLEQLGVSPSEPEVYTFLQ